ncbi:MAG: alpha/beta hydrolase [Gammaproteobacteria bacterium]|nr:alpha/beta hydrolase [Gammaproteobacteria bacterium]
MMITINDALVHVGNGGRDFNSDLPTVLFLHGSGLDHRSWALQTRWFAYNGFSVLAPDFPGHSLSHGEPLVSIEESGAWLADLLIHTGVKSAHVVGHSQGFLSALELAMVKTSAVKSLTGIATAAAIPVNPMLIDTAHKSAMQAADMMLQWGFGKNIHLGLSPTPGMQPISIGRQIMGNNPLAVDLQVCSNYKCGDLAASKIHCPASMILAGQDKMTPLKSGLALAEALDAKVTVLQEYGHMLPIEAPKLVMKILRDFILEQESRQGVASQKPEARQDQA